MAATEMSWGEEIVIEDRSLSRQCLDLLLQAFAVAVVGVHLDQDLERELGLGGVSLFDEGFDLAHALLDGLLAAVPGLQTLDLGEHLGSPRVRWRGALQVGGGLAGAGPVLLLNVLAVEPLDALDLLLQLVGVAGLLDALAVGIERDPRHVETGELVEQAVRIREALLGHRLLEVAHAAPHLGLLIGLPFGLLDLVGEGPRPLAGWIVAGRVLELAAGRREVVAG